jgi:hypothetical protein
MRKLHDRLLAILLSAILGLIPLQGAVAGVYMLQDMAGEAHPMNGHHDAARVSTAEHHTGMNCDACNLDSGCNGDNCSSGHCLTCLLALPGDFSFVIERTTPSPTVQSDNDLVKRHLSSLFRPPRL